MKTEVTRRRQAAYDQVIAYLEEHDGWHTSQQLLAAGLNLGNMPSILLGMYNRGLLEQTKLQHPRYSERWIFAYRLVRKPQLAIVHAVIGRVPDHIQQAQARHA